MNVSYLYFTDISLDSDEKLLMKILKNEMRITLNKR